MIDIAVIGSAGRMGKTVCAAVEAAEDMNLVAQIDHEGEISPDTLGGAQVAIEFTVPSQTEANVMALLDAGVDVVVGTTGWGEDALRRVRERAEQAGRSVVIAPNFGLSAVFAMKFAAAAAPYFESVEVIEMHHPDKVDAPSGTAKTTAQKIAAARASVGVGASPDATQTDPGGARGAVVDGVHVHAVRLRGLNAHEEILLGNPAEQLVIRQDSFDRTSFMPGVLLAARKVRGSGPLTYGLEKFLDI